MSTAKAPDSGPATPIVHLVEDDESARAATARFLRAAIQIVGVGGCHLPHALAEAADTARDQGVRCAEEIAYDVVLMDLQITVQRPAGVELSNRLASVTGQS